MMLDADTRRPASPRRCLQPTFTGGGGRKRPHLAIKDTKLIYVTPQYHPSNARKSHLGAQKFKIRLAPLRKSQDKGDPPSRYACAPILSRGHY
jgi:hypothetical protein